MLIAKPINEETEELDALFQVTDLFLANYHSKAEIVVNQGGTSSGKTYAIMQVLFTIACYEKDRTITVTSEDVPALKKGAYKDAADIYRKSAFLKYHVKQWHKADREIKFKNGSVIQFTTYDGALDAHQGKRDYLFINEANTVSFAICEQLMLRTKIRTFIDYNPTVRFWVHEEILEAQSEHVELLISDHRDNPYLTDKIRRGIEAISDPEKYKVYARGLTGNTEGLIYPNWEKIPDSAFPWNVEGKIVGIDFGYTIDKTAAVLVAIQGDKIYLHELIYETDLGAGEIVQILKEKGVIRNEYRVYCEHDPDMVSQLNRREVHTIRARKGDDSVSAGIQVMQKYKVYYTASSLNIGYERTRYEWDSNEVTGKLINKPKPNTPDHLLDAARYAVYTHTFMPE